MANFRQNYEKMYMSGTIDEGITYIFQLQVTQVSGAPFGDGSFLASVGDRT